MSDIIVNRQMLSITLMWSCWGCTVSLSALCLQELIITVCLKDTCSRMTYTFCNDLFLRVRHHCCWVSNVVNKKKLICVNVDDFRTVVVTLTRQKVDFANICKTSREVRSWCLQSFIHWTFLQTMIVGLCVRNSSYEKKQIDQSLSLSLSDMFNHQICWLWDHLLAFFSNINSCRLMIKLINFEARCWTDRRQVQKRVWRQHTFDTSTHTLKLTVMILNLKLRGEYVLHIDVARKSATIEPDMR